MNLAKFQILMTTSQET